MSIEVISFILLRIMPVIFIICFVFYLVNAFRYREIAFRYLINAGWMPYVYKAEICLAGVFSLFARNKEFYHSYSDIGSYNYITYMDYIYRYFS